MRNVYKTIIRPHLEYCAQLWSPPACHGNWATIIELENVQRKREGSHALLMILEHFLTVKGWMPYRLQHSQMRRRVRGDLIEAYKIVNGLVEYGKDIFNLSRSGDKIVSTKSNNIDRNIKTLSNNFLSERVISFWNKLPSFVRNSVSVIDFKINLEEFKKTNNLVDTGNFWEVSNIVLAKIEGVNYIEKKKQQVQYLYKNPCVAKRKGINIS